MIVNDTNISARKYCYLDLNIDIYQGMFRELLYDKREDYKFKVILYPFLDGNVPINLSYGTFISQLVRLARVNSTLNRFKHCVTELLG